MTRRKSLTMYVAGAAYLLAVVSVPQLVFPQYRVWWFALTVASIGLMFISVAMWGLLEGGLRNTRGSSLLITLMWFSWSAFILVLGMIRNPITGHEYAWGNDLGHIAMFSAGMVFADRSRWPFLRRIIWYGSLLGLAGGILGLRVANFAVVSSINQQRGLNVWTESYGLWGMLFSWPYLIFRATLSNADVGLAVTSSGLYVVLGLLFLKRVVLFEAGLVIAVLLYQFKSTVHLRAQSVLKTGLLLLVLVGVGILGRSRLPDMAQLYSSVLTRLTGSFQDFGSTDRIIELQEFFEHSSASDVIVGHGLGSTQTWNGSELEHLHIGWGNAIFKGGFPLIGFLVVGGTVILIRLKDRTIDTYHRVLLSTAVFYLGSMLVSPVWSWGPASFLFGACFFSGLARQPSGRDET